jgi:hypothetical protein
MTLVMKRNPDSFAGRQNVIFAAQYRNALFYNSELGKTFKEFGLIELPIYAYGSSLLGEYVLVMRDLKLLRGAKPFNEVMGNQIFGDGCQDIDLAVRKLRALFSRMARVHARYWCDAKLLAYRWLKHGEQRHNSGWGRFVWQQSFDNGAAYWQRAKRVLSSLDARLVALVDRSFAHSSFEQAVRHLETMRFTLIHGDFHASNMFTFDGSEQEGGVDSFRLVDYTEIGLGEPTTDIGQCLISDMHHSFFAQHVQSLLAVYHAALVDAGVADYSLDECRADFARCSIEKWIFMFALMAGWPGMPENLIMYLHDQLLHFVELFGDFDATYKLTNIAYFQATKPLDS